MMTVIQAFIAKFYQAVIIALTAFLILLLIGFRVQTWRVSYWKPLAENAETKCTGQIQKIELKQQGDLITAQEKVRAAEQKAAQQVSEIESKLHEQNTKASADQTKLLNDVRSGTISMRDRFTCPRTTNNSGNSVPNATASANGDLATEKRGLQREDAEFLISESERANQVVRQLTACQAILIQERSNEKALK